MRDPAIFRHKNIRLGIQNYLGRRWYFVTICCQNRRRLFNTAKRAAWLLKHLRDNAQEYAFAIHAYCLMPDHLHFLAEGKNEQSNLMVFVEGFKQSTGFLYYSRTGGRLWQKKYYDHIVRQLESVDAIAWYIWMNPVRKELCDKPADYPFSGSLTSTIEMLKPTEEKWRPPWKTKPPSSG